MDRCTGCCGTVALNPTWAAAGPRLHRNFPSSHSEGLSQAEEKPAPKSNDTGDSTAMWCFHRTPTFHQAIIPASSCLKTSFCLLDHLTKLFPHHTLRPRHLNKVIWTRSQGLSIKNIAYVQPGPSGKNPDVYYLSYSSDKIKDTYYPALCAQRTRRKESPLSPGMIKNRMGADAEASDWKGEGRE